MTDLHVAVRGEGSPALVFLHPFAASGRVFEAMVSHLAPRHRCICVDLRGFGRSPAADSYTVASHAADAIAAADAACEGRYALVGHSMGGKIALAAAAMRPERLAALALLAPSPPTPEPIDEPERIRRLAAHGDAAAARAALADAARLPIAPDDADRWVADNVASSESAWAWWLRSGSRELIADSVERIVAPILLITGGLDPIVPLDALTPILAAHPSAAQTLFADAGHLLPLEAPRACAERIAAFAAKLAPDSRALL